MKTLKTLITSILTLLTLSAYSQSNDTAALRKAGVKYIEHKSYMSIFGSRADTCIENKLWVNAYGLVEKEIINHNCKGWDVVTENQFTYDKNQHLVKHVVLQNDMMLSETTYQYDEKGDAVEYKVVTFDPERTIIVKNNYFYDKNDRLDSIRQTNFMPEDTISYLTNYSYREDGQVADVKTKGPDGKVLQSNTYTYNKKDQLIEVDMETVQPKYNYSTSVFTYDENDRLYTSTDTDSGITIERFYYENGLLQMAMHFSKLEELIKKVHFVYTYR